MKIRTFALLTALTLVNRATADTNQYVFTTIDLGETSDYSLTGTYLTGISASEQIVGYYSDGYSNRHAFVYAKGIFTRLQVPGSNFNEPLSISPSGKIVGICSMPGANIHLFVYDHGTYTIIPDPPSAQPGQTHASGINDAGQIAGYFVDKNYRYQAFVFNGGIYSTFDVNGLPNPQAQGINNSGQITGLVGKHGFVGQNNPFTILPDPPIQTSYSRAYPTFSGINASGQIVGTFWDSQSSTTMAYSPLSMHRMHSGWLDHKST